MRILYSALFLFAGTLSTFAYTHTPLTKTTTQLNNNTIYHVRENVSISNATQPALYVQPGDTAIIFVHEKCHLWAISRQGNAGINVPQGATLIIVGDPGSLVNALGGDATDGVAGGNGGNADVYAVKRKDSYTGAGGTGGRGGRGAGAGIGGNGGKGGEGGTGGESVYTYDYQSKDGLAGIDGQNGENGQSMGSVYVMGDVVINAVSGSHKPLTSNGGTGKADKNRCPYFWSWKYMSAGAGGGGGGGAGGTGLSYDICGGAGGGGGGGGAGSGALDCCDGFFNYTRRCCGQGGGQGQGQQGLPAQPRNVPNQEDTENDNKFSGKGGKGGNAGQQGTGGLVCVAKKSNIDISRVANVTYINANNCPINTSVRFENMIDVEAHEPDYRFYYAMPVREQITPPAAVNRSIQFCGYYTADNQLIYDEKGQLTPDGENLHKRFENVSLTARWAGPAHVRLTLKYQEPNATQIKEDWTYFAIDSLVQLKAGETRTISFNPKDYLKEHYRNSDSLWTITVRPDDKANHTFTYTLEVGTMMWRIYDPPQANLPFYMLDAKGEKVLSLDEQYCYGATIVEPTVYCRDEEAKKRFVSQGWKNKPTVMTATELTSHMNIVQRCYPVYRQKCDSGVCIPMVRQEVVEECYYEDVVYVRSVPEDGFASLMPRVYSMVEDTIGDTIPLTWVDKNTCYYVVKSATLVQPRFKALHYRMTVEYEYEPGTEHLTCETWATTKHRLQDSLPAVEAESLDYKAGDYVLVMGKIIGQPAEDYNISSVALLPNMDTVPLHRFYINIIAEDQQLTLPCYVFEAPADKVQIMQHVSERKKADCKIFNNTWFSSIDSIRINDFPAAIPADSVVHLHEGDRIAIMVSNADQTMVNAGYWHNSEWVKLPICSEKRLQPDGSYMTYYIATAPKRSFEMGLNTGTLLPLKYCATPVEWVAPGAAQSGDTIAYRIVQKETNKAVSLDSVKIVGKDNQVIYRFVGEKAWNQTFVMPDTVSGIYVHAHEIGDTYSVTFLNDDGTIMQYDNRMLLGDSVIYQGDVPEKASGSDQWRYQFIGWSIPIHPVCSDAVYVAQFRPYVMMSEDTFNETLLQGFDKQTIGIELHISVRCGVYQTITLPFNLSTEQFQTVFGQCALLTKFTDDSTRNDSIHLIFHAQSNRMLQAGYPYMICPAATWNQVTMDSVVIDLHLDTVIHGATQFIPVVSPQWLNDEDTQVRFLMDDKIFWPTHSTGPMRALSAYFRLNEDIETSVENPAEMIITINNDDQQETVSYNGCADPYTGIEYSKPTYIDAPSDPSADSLFSNRDAKFLINGCLYIFHNGCLYDVWGNRHTELYP